MTAPVKTLCPYCGVGCGLEVSPVEPASTKPANKLPANKSTGKSTDKSTEPSPDSACQSWKVRGDRAHPSSLGMVCVKGATVVEPLERDRLLHPMMRDSLEEPFRRATWEEAYDRIVTHIQTVRTARGADALCMYGSGQFQTEDYYVAQKLMKGCLGTNNFDANSRLCMSSAVSGYIQSLGSDGPPCCYDDLELTDCAFLIGTNTAECHPIVFNRLRKHHKQNRNVKMIVVDPRRTPTAEAADLHLAIRPGTDIDLLNGIAYLLFHWGAIDAQFIDECTNGYPEFVKVIKQYAPERVARVCGIDAKEVEAAARYWRAASRPLSLWSMGINQSSEGTAKARSIINLHLMTGTIGKPGCGPFSLTGQPNAMGGREAGGLSHLLPGYRSVKDPQHRAEVEKAWNLPAGQISSHPGRSTWDIITGLESGDVEFVWIAATNPAVSLPDLERAKKALMRSPLTVYQETYYPTETAAYAHILLPTTQWSEKAGTMTNSERRVTFCPAFREPMGEAKTDWEIFAEVGRRLGFAEQFWFRSASDVRREFVELTHDRPCEQSALTHEFLQEHGPTQWPQSPHDPIPTDRTPAKRLYTDHHFPTPDGCARFSAYHSKGLAEPPDPAFPFVLTIGRLYGHWHTQARTGRIEKIRQMHPNPFLEIHPRDAEKLNITEGALVEVRSRRGMVCCPALITRGIAPGTVFLPMHWGFLWAELAEANTLTHSAACPDSLEPELKACAVQLKLLKAAPVEPRQTNRLIATIRGMAQGLFSE